jgi:hypothetical protein
LEFAKISKASLLEAEIAKACYEKFVVDCLDKPQASDGAA